MSVVSFALAVIFIIRLFSTSVFRVPKLCYMNVNMLLIIFRFYTEKTGVECTQKNTVIFHSFRPEILNMQPAMFFWIF